VDTHLARIEIDERWQTVCLVRESSARIVRLGKCPPVEFRAGALEQGGVLLVPMLVRIDGRLYATWVDYCDPGVGDTPAVIRDLSEQPHILVRMYGDRYEQERVLSVPNPLRRWFGDLHDRLDAAPPWTPGEFDAARAAAYRDWPTVRQLWKAVRPAKARCEICSGAVLAPRRTYCSRVCAQEAHNRNRHVKRKRRKCRRCGTWFRPTRKGHVVCGAACRQAEVRERASRRDWTSARGLALLRADVRQIGLELPLTKQQNRDADAAERHEAKRAVDSLLRSAGLDPRPARKGGRARHTPPAEG